jgi:hypothetical protein
MFPPYFFLILIIPALVFLAVIVGIVWFIVRRLGRNRRSTQNKDSHLQVTFSREDAVSQSFLLFSLLFLGVTLTAFNRDLGDPFSWRTILLIIALVGLFGAYYLKTIYTLVVSLVGLMVWWGAQATAWLNSDLTKLETFQQLAALKPIKPVVVVVGIALLALLLYSVGHWHEKQIKFKRFALVYLVLGIVSVTGLLAWLSSKIGLEFLGDMTRGQSLLLSWPLTISMFVLLVALVGVTIYVWSQKLMSLFEVLAIFILTGLFGFMIIMPEQSMFLSGRGYYGGTLSSEGVLWALIFNLAIFFELLGLILSGYVRRETWLVNLGALFLFLLIIVKYFDWFFTFMDKSLFFIGAGILLFLVGWFMERGRRYMISNIKAQTEPISQ